jgi:hypothetical protein
MLFISDEEYAARLRGESYLPPSPDSFPASFPLPLLPDISTEQEEEKGPILPPEILSPVTQEEPFSPELLDKLLNPVILSNGKVYPGRGSKGFHVDEQAGIGVTAGILGTTKSSRLAGVSISSAHSYERGYTGPVPLVDPSKSPKEELRNKIIEGHGIIVDKCFNRLLQTLELLDDDKLAKVQKATELSIVAKNLSGIIASASAATQDKLVDNKEQSVHFHIMRPEPALHDDYPTINIDSSPDLPKDPSS